MPPRTRSSTVARRFDRDCRRRRASLPARASPAYRRARDRRRRRRRRWRRYEIEGRLPRANSGSRRRAPRRRARDRSGSRGWRSRSPRPARSTPWSRGAPSWASPVSLRSALRRCVVRWDAAQAERAVKRLRTVAREAAAQSRRARLPEIAAVAELADFVGRPGVVVADLRGGRIEALGPAGGGPPAEVGSSWSGPRVGSTRPSSTPFRGAARLSLGPHVLRAETAPIAAVAVLVGRARELSEEWQL